MFNKKLILASFIVAAATIPYILMAQGNPAVTSFKVTGSFVGGSSYTVALGNVPDLTKTKPSVSLDGMAFTVTSTTTNTITGKLPEGVPKKGGSLKIKYQDTEVPYTLYVPYIDNINLPKVETGAQMIINGGNFSDKGCNARIPDSSYTVRSCNQRMIFITLGSKFNGGDITVTFNDLTSAPFRFNFQGPSLIYAENKNGIRPDSDLIIHAKGLSSAINENEVSLDSVFLPINVFKPRDGILQVKLPADNAKGPIKLKVNGIESNTLNIDSSYTPILIDYKTSDSPTTLKINVSGKYFSSDISKVSVSIGSKVGKTIFSNQNYVEAEFPKQGYSGCLSVKSYDKVSNCLSYNTLLTPKLKGFLDPITNISENTYEWTLFGENLSDKTQNISVYINNAKAELKTKFLNQLVVKSSGIPDKGEIYIVSEGIESNRMNYDFGERFYPSITSISSNGKFLYGQPITINGNNLGQNKYKKDVSISVKGVGLAKIEDKNELDLNITPAQIIARLDDKVKAGVSASISVSVKGKKSNELTFVTGQENKNVICKPWIQKVQYPDGIMIGAKIRILGQCFTPDIKQNWIYFEGAETKPVYATTTVLDVNIPAGAKSKGKIKVKSLSGESNQTDFISANKNPNSFGFGFESLAASTQETDKEISLGKLQITNTIGEVEMQTLKFKVVYEDDKNNPESYIKLGPLPLSDIKISFSGDGTKTIKPTIVERTGTNTFYFTLNGIRILPSLTTQTLDFKATVKSFALKGAKLHVEFDPAKAENFSGIIIKGDKREILKLTQKSISGPVISISKTDLTCVDSDSKKANCGASASKPSLPKN